MICTLDTQCSDRLRCNNANRCLQLSSKQRGGDQPLPTKNDKPCIQDLVIADMDARKSIGVSRYGTTLQPFNGRDALKDAYEEAVDLATYLRQVLFERDGR